MKKAIFAALMAFSATAMAYQPPIHINQIGNTTMIQQGGNTTYCNRVGNTIICN